MELEKKKASQTDSVESYEDAFKRITQITGENDLDLLVNKFIENEDINFALFNYVNEQNNEKETIEESIQKVAIIAALCWISFVAVLSHFIYIYLLLVERCLQCSQLLMKIFKSVIHPRSFTEDLCTLEMI